MPTTLYVNGRGNGQIQADPITTITVGAASGVLVGGVPTQPGESTDGIPYSVFRIGQGVIKTGFLRGDGFITIP